MLSGFTTLLRRRNFLFLTLAGTMSQLGDRLSHMLLITLIGIAAPGKLLAYSGGALTFVLPTLLLSPIAGVLVDHWDKRLTIARTHFIQTAVLLSVPFLINLTKSFTPFWIALTIFFGLDIFNNIANPALLPNLVGRDKILLANSINLAFARIATVLGMVIGGFLIKWVGWQRGVFIDSSCHLIAGILALNIAINRYEAQSPPDRAISTPGDCPGLRPRNNRMGLELNLIRSWLNFFRELGELVGYVFHNPLVAFVLTSIVISSFISAVSYTTLIFLVQQVLRLGTAGVGVFAGILAIGMIAGAAGMGLVPQNINRPLVVIGVTFLYGLLFLIGTWLITIWFMVLVALIAGIAFSWLGIVQNTILQEEVAEKIRGRVFSSREFVTNATFLITTIFIGTIGDLTSYRIALAAIGVSLILISFGGAYWVSRLSRKAG